MLNVNTTTTTITTITEEVQVVQLSTEHFDNLAGAEFFLQRTFGKNFARTWEPSRGAKRYYLPAALYAGYSFESAYRSNRVESGTYLGEVMTSGAERASLVLEAVELWLESTPESGTTLHLKTKPCRTVEEEVTQNLLAVINAALPQPVVEEELSLAVSKQPIKAITSSRQEFKISDFTGAVDVNHASNFAKNVVGSEQGGFLVTGTVARYGLLSAPILEQMGYGLEFTSNWGLQKVTSLNGVKIDRSYVNTLDGIISTYDFNIEFRADGVFFTFCRKDSTNLEDAAVDTAFLDLVNDLFLSFNKGEFNESDEPSPVVEYNDMGELSREIESIMESEGAVLATCYTTSEESIFTPQNSKHVYHFSVGSEPSTLEYYLSEETLTGKDGYALLEEYHGGGAYREVVEIENLPTYVSEVFGGTHLTEEAYEHMMTMIAM